MRLVVDIGNTFAKAAVFDGDTMAGAVHCRRTQSNALCAFIEQQGQPASCALSAVADIDGRISGLLERLGCPVLRVDGSTPVPFENSYRTPATLGSDRIAAISAAATLLPQRDVLIIDAGTCITFDFIDASGRYLGGNISPGTHMRFAALHHQTARLPFINERGGTPLLGYNTATAIRSGVLRGINHEINGYIEALMADYAELCVLLTGGKRSKLKTGYVPEERVFIEPHLVEKGLNALLRFNKL